MKVFITGAAGFIAAYIIPTLLKQNNEVIAFDIAPMPAHLSQYKNILTYIRGDLTDRVDLYRAVCTTKPTHILHLGSILAGPCEANPTKGFDINFNSTATLLDAAYANGVKRFVLASSISVFGIGLEEPVPDGAVKIPGTVYGQTKLACEHLVNWYNEKGKVSASGVRFPWVFGPGRTNGITAIWSSKLLDQMATLDKVEIEYPDQVGDWLYVKDAMKALLYLLEVDKTPSTIYNIMGSSHTIREVIEKTKIIRPNVAVTYKEGQKNNSPYPSSYSDEKARKEINWKPSYTIEEAIKEHIEIVSSTL